MDYNEGLIMPSYEVYLKIRKYLQKHCNKQFTTSFLGSKLQINYESVKYFIKILLKDELIFMVDDKHFEWNKVRTNKQAN